MKTKVLIPKEKIAARVAELANQIAQDYQGKNLVIIGILTGSFVFLSDLIRVMWEKGLDIEVQFIGASRYQENQTLQQPILTKDLSIDIVNRHILVVEDVVDEGYTLDFVLKLFSARKPSSLKTLVLLSKPQRREVNITLDYVGFEIPNYWVMGYGLDTNGKSRGIPDIVTINTE